MAMDQSESFDVDWKDLLKSLPNLSSSHYHLLDARGQFLAEAGTPAPACRLVQQTDRGGGCSGCWARLSRTCTETIHHCRAQLAHLVVPLRNRGAETGVLLCGGFRVEGRSPEEEPLRQLAAELSVSPGQLCDAYRQSPTLSPGEIAVRRQSLEKLFVQQLLDLILSEVIRDIPPTVTRVDGNRLWQRIADAVQFVISRESEVEIFTVAPAHDVVVRVYPRPDEWDGQESYDTFRHAEATNGALPDEQGRLVLLCRSRGRTLAVLRVRSPGGLRSWLNVIGHLRDLAWGIADALFARRERQARLVIDRLDEELSHVTGYQKRLGLILAHCREQLVCEDGEVLLYCDDEAQSLKVVAKCGTGTEDLPLRLPSLLGINRRVLQDNKADVVPDTARDADYAQALRMAESTPRYRKFLERIRACVKLPLAVGNDVLGLCCLHRGTAGPFNLGRVHVLEMVLERAAAEITWALANERESRRASQLRGKIEVPENLAKRVAHMRPAQARQHLLQELSSRALEMSRAYRAAVCVVDPDWTKVAIVAKQGDWPETGVMEIPFTQSNSAVVMAIKQGRSYLVEDVNEPGAHYLPYPPDRTKATVAIPLCSGTHTLGILAVEWETTGAFDRVLVDSLEMLAERYAWVIQNFHVDQQLARLQRSLELYRNEGGTGSDYQEFLKLVADMLNVGEGAVFIRNRDTGRYEEMANLIHEKRAREYHNYYEPTREDGVTGWILEQNKPLKIDNLDDAAALAELTPPARWKNKLHDNLVTEEYPTAYLGVPISVGDEVFGVARFNIAAELRRFDSVDLQVALAAALRLAGCLYERTEAKRTGAKLRLSVQIPKVQSLQEMCAEVFRAIETGLGAFAGHIRILDTFQEGAAPVEHVLLRVAHRDPFWTPDAESAGRPPWSQPLLMRRRGDHAAGRVWETNETLIDQDPNGLESLCAQLGTLPSFLKNIGALVVVPLVSDDQFAGTLHVYRQYRYSFNRVDVAFLEEVARIAAAGLLSVREKEARRLEVALKHLGEEFLIGILRSGDLPAQEKGLYRVVLHELLKGLGSTSGWVAVPDRPARAFQVLDRDGREVSAVSPVPAPMLNEFLGPKRCRVVTDVARDPVADSWLRQWNPGPPHHVKVGEDRQVCLLGVEADGELLAVFCLAFPLPQVISYATAELAADLLKRIGHQIAVAREVEQSRKDAAVSEPLVLTGAMASSLEHEMRGPVNRLVKHIEYLQERPRTEDQLAGVLVQMREQTLRLEANVRGLIYIGTPRQEAYPKVDLVQTLQGALADLAPGDDWYELRTPPEKLYVRCVARAIQDAFRFVLKNALLAVKDKPSAQINIAVELLPANECRVVIRDTGRGMTEKEQANALKPFFSTRGGSGLGLPAAYSIIRCHRGRFHLDSRLNEGTTVTITLPLSDGGGRDAAHTTRRR